MTTEIRVPTLGESVSEATIGKWYKQPGEAVAADEPLVELETDKVTIDVPAPVSGTLAEILAKDGATVEVGALLGSVAEGAGAAPKSAPAPKKEETAAAGGAAKPVSGASGADAGGAVSPAPSAAKIMAETGLDSASIAGSGKRGQVLKGDVLAALEKKRRERCGAFKRAAPAG